MYGAHVHVYYVIYYVIYMYIVTEIKDQNGTIVLFQNYSIDALSIQANQSQTTG